MICNDNFQTATNEKHPCAGRHPGSARRQRSMCTRAHPCTLDACAVFRELIDHALHLWLLVHHTKATIIAVIAQLLLTIRLRMAYSPLTTELSMLVVIKPSYKPTDLPPLTRFASDSQVRVRYCGVVRTH